MNLNETKALLTVIATAYDRPIPAGKAEIWARALEDLPFDLGRLGAEAAIRVSEYPPTAATVRKHAEEIAQAERQRQARQARVALAAGPAATPEEAPARSEGPHMLRHVLGRLREARVANGGHRLGTETAVQVADGALAEWRRDHPEPSAAPRLGGHCGNPSCQCTHTDGCEAGWIDVDASTVRACKSCHRRAWAITTDARNAAHAGAQLRDTSDAEEYR